MVVRVPNALTCCCLTNELVSARNGGDGWDRDSKILRFFYKMIEEFWFRHFHLLYCCNAVVRRETVAMNEKVYFRINFQVCVPYITGWRDCFGMSNDCNVFCNCVMVSGLFKKKIFKMWDWSGILLELPLLVSCEI